jgi:tetratricopeptide (TPR) repeat protein
MRRLALLCILTGLAAAIAAAPSSYAASSWTFGAAPSFALPLFAGDGASDPVFSNAWGASLQAERQLQGPLSLKAGFGWSMAGINPVSGVAVSGSLTELALSAGASYGFGLGRLLSADAFVEGGGGYGLLSSGASAFFPLGRAGAGLGLSLGGGFDARFEASFAYKGGLYGGLGLGLGLSWTPPESKAKQNEGIRLLELRSIEISPVFPILRSYYDEHSFGTVTLTNKSKKEAQDIRVSLEVKSYMDAPRELAVVKTLAPGASVEVPVTALFNEEMLKVTEPTKVIAEIAVTVGGVKGSSKTAALTIQDRTALTWDDDRKAAAFVSSKDPWVLDLVGNINATVRDSRNGEVPKNLQSAMALHEGLLAYGIGYLLSPSRPFAQAKVDAAAVDNLKFPRQTLSYRSGDCADLSVLYSSCLEAMGIETAFITVPGHIFMAAALGLSPAEAAARGIDSGLLVVQDGRCWLPIETTIRDKGFSEVWRAAADQWKDCSAKGTAAFYPVHDAWKFYAPVGLPADGSMVLLPSKDAVLSLFKAELEKIVQAQLSSRVAALGTIPEKGASGKALNDRGILYGRYGRLQDAERDFRAAAKVPFAPAVVNLGNIALLKGDAAEAFRCFKQASAASPSDPRLLANLAKAAAALGKGAEVESALSALKAVDPAAATRYASLAQSGSSGTRAAEMGDDSLAWF